MAKKLYLKDKYIVADYDDGTIDFIPAKDCVFEKTTTGISIQNRVTDVSVGIDDADAATWDNSAGGGVPYTSATLLDFCIANTANFNSAVTSLDDIPDVPAYSGNEGRPLQVNSTEDGIEYGAKEAFFYIDADGIGGNPVEVGNHAYNTTGLTFLYTTGVIGNYAIVSNEAQDFRKVWCSVGSTQDAIVTVPSIVDAFGQVNINLRKYMIDTATPVTWGLTNVWVHIKILP